MKSFLSVLFQKLTVILWTFWNLTNLNLLNVLSFKSSGFNLKEIKNFIILKYSTFKCLSKENSKAIFAVIQNDKKHSNKQIRSKSNYSSCGSGSTRHITTNAYYNNTSSFKSKWHYKIDNNI